MDDGIWEPSDATIFDSLRVARIALFMVVYNIAEHKIYYFRLYTIMNRFEFDNRSFVERKREYERITKKYNDRAAVVVEKGTGIDLPNIVKTKYLVPHDLSVSQFMYVIRKQIKVNPEISLVFVTKNGYMLSGGDTILNVYGKHRDDDGFLKISYCLENTFG